MKKVLDLLTDKDRNSFVPRLLRDVDDMKILAAKNIIYSMKDRYSDILSDLSQSEFKVFSQWGDDGIIQFLINYLDIKEKTFIEFGVESYREANTRFLLEHDNWRGLIMDGSQEHMDSIKRDTIYWKYELTAECAFLTAENINQIIENKGFKGEIGLLHIDVDGNDYWIWKAINAVDPQIVIVEYNSLLGADQSWTIPYAPDFQRSKAHHSNLYFGASIAALCDLAEEKGYAFIGSNSNGNNAYFAKKGELKGLKPLTAQEGYRISRFREGRNKDGSLTFMDFNQRYDEIKGMKIFNTRAEKVETIV